MSAYKDKGKRERYVMLRYWMLNSAAWKSLPGLARALYVEIVQRYNGLNNGHIPYSVRDAAQALRVSKDTVRHLLGILQARGFIVCTRKGYFSVKTTKDASEWRLTEYDSDHPVAHATKDFMRWQLPEDADIDALNRQPSHHRKFRTRYPQPDRTVPPAALHGTPHRTVKPKKRQNGTPSRTVKAKNAPSTVPPAGHLQLPGIGSAASTARGSPEHEPAHKKPWATPHVEEIPWDTLPTELRMMALGLPAPVPEPEIQPPAEFEELPPWKEWNAASGLAPHTWRAVPYGRPPALGPTGDSLDDLK